MASLTPTETTQKQLSYCLKEGEILDIMLRECPPEVYWLWEFLFPANRVRMSENGQFNMLEIMMNSVGPATFSSLCTPKATTVNSGQEMSLETFTAPLIYEETPMAVCDTDEYVVHPETGMMFNSWAEKVQYVQALKAGVLMKRLRKRMELMAAEILKEGKLNIRGPNVEDMVIDFGRDANNEIVIDPADRFCADTSSPLDLLDDIVSEVFLCEGEGTIDVIFSQKGYKAFRNHKQIVALLEADSNACQGCLLDMEMYPRGTTVVGQRSVGSIGNYNFWVSEGKMNMPDGAGGFEMTRTLEQDDVYLVMRDAFKGTRGYGMIKTMRGIMPGTVSLPATDSDDCIMQKLKARPLPIPGNINATAVLKGVVACD